MYPTDILIFISQPLCSIHLKPILYRTVSTTAVDEVPLIRSRANAATIAAQCCTTALRLAFIVLEEKQIVGADFHWRAAQRNIRGSSTPTTGSRREIRSNVHTIVRSNRRSRKSRTWGLLRNQIIHEPLTNGLGPVRHSKEHADICQKQDRQHDYKIRSTGSHSTRCNYFSFNKTVSSTNG